jgi:hypothetical protein
MARQLVLGLLGLIIAASPAAAHGPYRYFYPPVPYCYPPVIYVPLCPPPWTVVPPMPAYPPPRVQQEGVRPDRGQPGVAKPEPARPDAGKPDSAPGPRPAGPGVSRDGPGELKPAAFDIKRPGADTPGTLDIPKPRLPVPEKAGLDPDRIPLVAPPRPADPDAGAVPMIPVPNVPAKPEGVSPPSIPLLPPPGKSKEDDGPKLPPLRGVPDPSRPGLSLPVPGGDPGKSTSKASPLTARPRPLVDVIPVAGAAPADPAVRRRVNFFNHTDRDLWLVVEGQAVTLPRRHQITASVPPTFIWQLDGGAEQKTAIPATAPGVEVVIRR